MSLNVTSTEALICCAGPAFAEKLSARSPYRNAEDLIETARKIWWEEVDITDWQAAFDAHPRIGNKVQLREKFGRFAELSHTEQSRAMAEVDEAVFEELAAWNKKYEDKFGHIFIVCATGKAAGEMLQMLKERYLNTPYEELAVAAREQMKITELRLDKLLQEKPCGPPVPADMSSVAQRRTGQLLRHLVAAQQHGNCKGVPASASGKQLRSPITTHVLDSTLGCPARGLQISLLKVDEGGGTLREISQGVTDDDGRIGNLLPPADEVAPGHYQMKFMTGPYLMKCRSQHPAVFAPVPFYPHVVVDFVISEDMVKQHFHVPLLLSPYGYSTYRGS